jgi:hypothetical protein
MILTWLRTERDSHPVGTTVQVTKLLDYAKVRKELAVKGSAKCLTKIRRTIQAYALARPAVQLRLRVLKARNNKGDFVYVPKANASVDDAAFKIIGKECALQCDWTALKMDGFELHAFFPKPTASGSRIANHGAFISVDSRPVSATRGTLKKIASTVRDKIRKANPSLTGVRDPFFCLNIICPTDSYDPNVEPAKDDVVFGDGNFVIKLVDRLLISIYPENTIHTDTIGENEDGMVMQPSQISSLEESITRPRTPSLLNEDYPTGDIEVISSTACDEQPRWRSSMYGIDEGDLELLQENPPPVVEEEEGLRDVAVSNPWTIARMNAPVKSKKLVSNEYLLSPAKSQSNKSLGPQSPVSAATPQQFNLHEPLTPETSSRTNVHNNILDDELRRSIQRLPQPDSQYSSVPPIVRFQKLPSFEERRFPDFIRPAPRSITLAANMPSKCPAALRSSRRNPKSFKNKSTVLPAPRSDETWFGQPIRGAPKAPPRKRLRQERNPFFPSNDTFNSQRAMVMPAVERLVEMGLVPKKNTDIRNFFGRPKRAPSDIDFTASSQGSKSQHIAGQLRVYAEQESPVQSSLCRPRSADSYHRSTYTAREMNECIQSHRERASTIPDLLTSPVLTIGETNDAHIADTRPRRCQTADDGLHRTKSSTLPLNFVPHGFETYSLVLLTNMSIPSIAQQTRKLNMSFNILEWGYDTTSAYDVFATHISERTIMDWVIKTDSTLHSVFERVPGVEVRGALHEGIQRFLNTRRQDNESMAVRATASARNPVNWPVVKDEDSLADPPLRLRDIHVNDVHRDAFARVKSDGASDFDLSESVNLDGDVGEQSTAGHMMEVDDGFGDGIDDEMLMDL